MFASRSQAVRRTMARHASRTFSSTETAASERLIIFDTTLRDGEQSPGATLNFQEKMHIAKGLHAMGVDVCEAGFPIASPGDFDAVKDIQRCYDAVRHAPKHRIHLFLATSDIHLKYKLKISRDECIRRAVEAVSFAASLTSDVEFSPEDAGRSDPDFLCDVLAEEYGNLFSYLIKNTRGSEKAIFSTHCHNDLGLATANALAGVVGGARQAEVTMNGIGERAGNTSLEELVMTLKTRPHLFPVHTRIDSTHIMRCSRMVSHYTGIAIQPNKAIVGANAFAHESGIHQDGVLKHQATYEIMLPESVGLTENRMVLGKHSGRHAYSKRLEELGYTDLTQAQLDMFVEKFKVLADDKKTVTDADMEAIVSDDLFKPETFWTLQAVHVTAGNRVKPTATITLNYKDGTEVSEAAMGSGPIDAIYSAISRATGCENLSLHEYTVESITDGIKALGDVTIRISENESNKSALMNPQTEVSRSRQYVGHGANSDILVASATAYVNAVNRLLAAKERDEAAARRESRAAA
ncbi:hypothetical protein SPRG_12368 [Saprolegnia parasitica CBS 223.65]|uniref:2-isopropylmalate synthase n=1 Tax=Saprolegnia parasitica (strain CBS 223.65) TaxID=695850 RepID=A0A067C5P0_SAPPC|nr:hypothetical protein SPRG_12368 [Saprolegnia parasitica CBS 223.65]KDO21866.1 hypothetical protein SPRG_12368 [Saprolegnia parasitica CBS 223.65]|eukprot:XP_012207422.1 hypothetical protein SPRG_12368 [Saprolegnia parasitica CBS 223.65]